MQFEMAAMVCGQMLRDAMAACQRERLKKPHGSYGAGLAGGST
jgi:hypothetical protein